MQPDATSNLKSEFISPIFSDTTQGLVDGSSFVTDTTLYQEKVASRIQQLKLEIRVLKSCHNSATIPCRLPVEILSRVFLFLSHSGSEADPWLWGDENSVSFRWIRATHVCRRWRSAATNCASLRTHLR